MKPPNGGLKEPNVDHPVDFSARVGWDLYLNPWWGLRFLNGPAERLADLLTARLGKPVLNFQPDRAISQLEWRLDGATNIPSFWVNLSGGNGSLWFHFRLPWQPIVSIQDAQNAHLSTGLFLGGFSIEEHEKYLTEWASSPAAFNMFATKTLHTSLFGQINDLLKVPPAAVALYVMTLAKAHNIEIPDDEEVELGSIVDRLPPSVACQRWPFPPWDGPEDERAPTIFRLVRPMDKITGNIEVGREKVRGKARNRI